MTIIVNGSNTPTAGSVGYGDGTNLAFTGSGTSGQVLTSAGTGTPAWTTPSGGAMALISTKTATNAATIQWTGLTGYSKYLLIYNSLQSGATNDRYAVQFGTGSTPTWLGAGNYNYGVLGWLPNGNSSWSTSNTVAWGSSTTNANSGFLIGVNENSTFGSYGTSSGTLNISGLLSSTDYATLSGNFYTQAYYNGSTYTGEVINCSIAGQLGAVNGASPVTAIRLISLQQSSFTGTASLYGISS